MSTNVGRSSAVVLPGGFLGLHVRAWSAAGLPRTRRIWIPILETAAQTTAVAQGAEDEPQ